MTDTNMIKKSLTFASRFRHDVEQWLKFHGMVLSGAEWCKPFADTRGTITFEHHYWVGTIFERLGN